METPAGDPWRDNPPRSWPSDSILLVRLSQVEFYGWPGDHQDGIEHPSRSRRQVFRDSSQAGRRREVWLALWRARRRPSIVTLKREALAILQVLLCVRIASALRACVVLLANGHMMEMDVLFRTIDDFLADITFADEIIEQGIENATNGSEGMAGGVLH